MKQKKVHTFNILIVTINADGHQYGEFEYVKDISMYTHDFIINCNRNGDFGYILIVDVDIQNTFNHYLRTCRKNLHKNND